MSPRAPSRHGAAQRTQPRLASGRAARPKSGLLRRIGRIALYGAIGFIIGSIALVALYRVLPPPGTPLMLIRRVEGYGIDKTWRPLNQISPYLIRAVVPKSRSSCSSLRLRTNAANAPSASVFRRRPSEAPSPGGAASCRLPGSGAPAHGRSVATCRFGNNARSATR